MDKPLEIVFHGISSSPAVEADIRRYVEKLEHRFGHLTRCRVAVELLHRQHKTGNVFNVHIEMGVPGEELVVTRAPHHARERFAQPDLATCMRDAFRAAERRLADFKQRISGDVKPHEEVFAGRVAQLHPDADHGFILTHEGTQLYFHRNSLMEGAFDRLAVGDAVRFTQIDGDTGPLAHKVWPAAAAG